jgi:periplasmic divalent cation tolerance protein
VRDAYIQVSTTAAKAADARAIARALVTRRLAACVQVSGPITSTYRWRGNIETAREWLCVAKARASLYTKVEAAIKALHPYEVPEIVATRISAGSAEYLAWLAAETKSAGRATRRR